MQMYRVVPQMKRRNTHSRFPSPPQYYITVKDVLLQSFCDADSDKYRVLDLKLIFNDISMHDSD